MSEVRRVVATALAEDLVPLGDLTAALLDPDASADAALVVRQAGRLAGRMCATEAFLQVDPEVTVDWVADDGDAVEPGQALATVRGPLASVLTAERTALNLLCHLSGVATLTSRYVAAAAGRCRVLDTRKTTPGLRALEKAAVRAGGGHNHRGSLSDLVLLKDNHLGAMSIAAAVDAARRRWPARTVEVECDRLEQAEEAVKAGADLVMLDNMTPSDVARCLRAIREWDDRVLVEVSGGVDLGTVADYAAAGPDFVSVGSLTHSAPALDIGLDLVVHTGPEPGASPTS
jgi:nicotinate-nucleotide pyrophosphorylase (carboxylating)